MEKSVKKFSSFEQAEQADIQIYKKMSYAEKFEELLQILASQFENEKTENNETEQRLQRVYRIIKPL